VYTCNPDVFEHCSFKVYNDSNGLSRSNISVLLKKELIGMLISYSIKLKTNSREYDFLFNQGTADVCNVGRGVIGNMLIKYFRDVVTNETSNYEFKCPQPPGFLYFNNIPTMDVRHIPRMTSRQEWEFTCVLRTKTKGSKRLSISATVKTTGTLF
jgi:Protein of unknown function (DUF1091)